MCLVLVEFQKKQDRIKLRERERPDHAGPRRKAMWIDHFKLVEGQIRLYTIASR